MEKESLLPHAQPSPFTPNLAFSKLQYLGDKFLNSDHSVVLAFLSTPTSTRHSSAHAGGATPSCPCHPYHALVRTRLPTCLTGAALWARPFDSLNLPQVPMPLAVPELCDLSGDQGAHWVCGVGLGRP